jgi:ABC-type transport system involved in cytochrome c biogenesis permease subunit
MSAPTVPHDYVGDQPSPKKAAARIQPNPIYRALRALASLQLTVVLFSVAMALVFFGTLGMTQDSIEGAVHKYFRCWVAWIDLQGLAEFGKVFFPISKSTSLALRVPFPGGYTIGWVMFVNLLAAHIVRFKLTWKRSGIFLLHAGVIVLLAGEFLTGQLSVETRMTIKEGESADFVRSLSLIELAVIDPSDPNVDQVVVVPGEMLEDARKTDWISQPELPFDFQVVKYFPNAGLRDLKLDEKPEADQGGLRKYGLESRPTVKGTDSDGKLNYPGAYLTLRGKSGEILGTYLFFTLLENRKQQVTVAGKTYDAVLRFQRTYKPYKVQLVKAEHDKYPGTEIPKDYASTVVVDDPAFGEHGPIRIWMNHPMYYRGETFYQSQMSSEEESDVKTTGLQVVRNPAWTFPYFACAMVALGMAFHFLLRLTAFLPKRVARTRPVGTVQTFEKFFPLALVFVAGLYLVGRLMTPSPKPDRFDLYGFGQIPVQHGGRIQPLDTVARNSLMVISGKSEFEDAANKDRVYPAIEWLLALWSKPDESNKFKILRADHPQLLALLGLPNRPGSYRYSMAELEPGMDKLERQAQVASKKEKDKRDSYDMRVLQLAEHVKVYRDLQLRLAPGFIPTEDPTAKWLSRRDILEKLAPQILPEAEQKAKDQVATEMHNNPNFLPDLIQKFIGDMKDLEKVAERLGGREAVIKMLLQEETNGRTRRFAADKLHELQGVAFPQEAVMDQLFTAYEKDKPADFNAAVADYKEKFTRGLSDTEKSKVGLEARMNHFDPFIQCQVLYLVAAILAALSWLVRRDPLRRAAFGLAAMTLAVHTAALIARMYIGNRPPVTNLYSSAVFIGWGSLALCLVLERIYRLGVGCFAGGLIGFATLYIARFLAESGDTLEMLQAVLDTNFWLATHVTCVTMGYMTTLVGGVLGLIYIVGGMFTNGLRGEVGKHVAGMMYGSLCFAMLLSFTGTVLGGIWADQSWGRFWGWDPKENGAVLVVIWNALILHARWAGLIKARGLAVLAVVGCMWTVWSWFGTNQLGIGLHAYGFDNRLANGCTITWIALGLVAGLGMVPPRFWASLGPPPQTRTA